jgi:hypothetical protein
MYSKTFSTDFSDLPLFIYAHICLQLNFQGYRTTIFKANAYFITIQNLQKQ